MIAPIRMTEQQAILEGFISVSAALASGNREIFSIAIREGKHDRALPHLESAARRAHVPVERLAAAQIDAEANGRTHVGVIARVGPRRFVPLEALLAGAASPFIAMVDGVEDPFNFGAAVRALYAAGAGGLVVRPRNWMSAAGTVARASAGASELIPTAIAETAAEAAAFFRRHGTAIACAADDARAASLYEADLRGPLFLLIGGEKRGITRSFIDRADLL